MKTNLLGYKYVYSFMLCVTMLFSYSISWGQGFEDFSNSNAEYNYSTSSFVGNNGITWSYVESRDGNGDANESGINLPALMLRQNNSSVTSSSISGGIGNFSVKLYKGFTGNGNRQVELFVNGVSQGASTPFDDFNEHVFTVNSIDISGDITIEIRNITGKQIIVDDISWTAAAPAIGPQITNITTTPAGGITSSDAVTVNADVTDAAGIANVALKWGTTSGSLNNSFAMTNTTADVYEAIIPAQADGTTVYYALEAENTTGDTNTSTEMSYTVLAPNLTTLPYTQTFDADLGDTYNYTVAGTGNWYQDSGEAVGNGYGESNLEEYWMVLPGIDFSGYNNVVMSFDSAADYGAIDANNYLKLFYSTDYSGLGDPTTATWTELSFTQPTVFGGATASGNIDLSAITDSQVFIAFKYYSTDDPTRWAVDNINIMEETPTMEASTASLTGLNYMDTNGPSAAQSFDLSGLFLDGTQDVTVEILMGDFEVSLDDVTYADSLTLTNYDGTITPVYVRLKAGHPQDMYADSVLINGYGLTEIEVSLEGEVTPVIAGATNLFFSKYVEGSSNNKYLEIYNGTGTTVDLSTYTVELYANGGTTANNTETLGNLIPVLGNGEVIVLKHSSAILSLPAGVTAHNSTVCNFNGDDAIVLKHNGSIIDIFGNIGCDPGSEWSEGGNNTQDRTLVRNTDICGGVTVNPTTACDFPTLATEWTGYPQDDVSTLGSHTANCGVSPIADYTYTSGSWSPEDPNGMASPTDNIEVLDGTATFNNAIEINNLSIATGATLEVKDVLTVNENITNDGNIIFKSTAIKTAQLDEFNGTISGNGDVVVERFIPAKRAFRLLSSPVNGQTFADAWQQNTHITGAGGAANGFDPTPTNNPSLFIFNNSLPTQAGGAAWEAVTSTTESINAGQGYRLMVRGDRTIDLTSQNPTPTPTTLMSKGDLATGNYTPILAQGAGFYSLIGNPYQAIVDFSQLTFSGDINNSNIYVWDPTMTGSNGRGAYVTVDVTSNSPSPSSSEANKYIMPGQAFFVQNNATISQAPSITFTENAKVTAQSQTSVFSTIDEFYVNFRLYKSSALQNDESESDAIGLRFADYYTTPSSDEDASKLANPGENFAVVNDKFTSIDKRAMPLDNEEIELFISGYEAQNYDIKFMLGHQPEDIKLYLNDNYLESSVEITDDMLYSFSVDSNSPASIAADRFYISFENVTMGTTQPNLADAIRIYPNPAADVLNIDVKNYEIEKLKIFNIQGQELNSVSSTKSINVSSLKSGVYILKVYTNQGTSVQKFIKK